MICSSHEWEFEVNVFDGCEKHLRAKSSWFEWGSWFSRRKPLKWLNKTCVCSSTAALLSLTHTNTVQRNSPVQNRDDGSAGRETSHTNMKKLRATLQCRIISHDAFRRLQPDLHLWVPWNQTNRNKRCKSRRHTRSYEIVRRGGQVSVFSALWDTEAVLVNGSRFPIMHSCTCSERTSRSA